MQSKPRHPLYMAFIIVMLLLLLAGVALLISGVLTPKPVIRPRMILPPIARWGLYG